tara:strand:- start:295 stop:510 length:216 start_codon:yes stop_codon:yes gene_type:complete
MKKVLLVFAMGAFLFSCGGPEVCDCVDNAMNVMDPSKFDKDLQKECEEYADGLSDEDKTERAKKALECLQK